MTIARHTATTSATLLLATTLAAAAATTAIAGERSDRIDETRAAQSREIEQGRYNGELTRREYRQLLAEQERIKELERRASNDGHISRGEYRDIRQAQADAEKHIQSDTHNANVSLWRRWLYRHRY